MEIHLYENEIPSAIIEGIQEVHQLVFDGDCLKESKFKGKLHLLAVVAEENGQIKGFKLGYEDSDGMFYSWLGGVHPAAQQRGIAAQLMKAQHQWCKEKGYLRVRTIGRNIRKAMLIVNLKAGFDIMETFTDAKGRHKILFEKQL